MRIYVTITFIYLPGKTIFWKDMPASQAGMGVSDWYGKCNSL